MDLWQLSIFCKVIELKGFSKAAEAVHLSQPTVSSHMKDLESHFGCRLIDRIDKKAIPTQAGEILYEYAGKLVALRDEAESALAEFQGRISGRLVIGGSTIPGGYILPRVVGDFRKEYPEVVVSLVVGDTEKIVGDILSGVLEFGVVGAKTEHGKIEQKKLIDDDMRLIVPGVHKWASKASVVSASLLREPFIIRESGSGTLKSIQNSLTKKGLDSGELNIVAELGSTAAVIQGIKNGVGISILSPIAVSDELERGTLKALKVRGLNLKRNFYLTRHKDRSSSPIGRVFMEFIQK
ncbi:MAG: LysR family transcriptional regulator, partial [Proteobacteria bacterium]|nr:LysR family transcriptional regulator [Pseudomonadota bacterium]